MSKSKIFNLKERFDEKDPLTKGFIEIIAIWLVIFIVASAFSAICITPKMDDVEIAECKSLAVLCFQHAGNTVINDPGHKYRVDETSSGITVSLASHLDEIEIAMDPNTEEWSYNYNPKTGIRTVINVLFGILFAFLPFVYIFGSVKLINCYHKLKEAKQNKRVKV